jgi:hypothetical protein
MPKAMEALAFAQHHNTLHLASSGNGVHCP